MNLFEENVNTPIRQPKYTCVLWMLSKIDLSYQHIYIRNSLIFVQHYGMRYVIGETRQSEERRTVTEPARTPRARSTRKAETSGTA